MQLLKGKKALVTGGTAGIGKEIALTFARHGAHVAIFGTNEERADAVLKELEAAKVLEEQKFTAHIVDVSKKGAAQSGVDAVLENWGSIDVLINNAGITRDTLFMKMKEEEWDDVIAVNLKSVYNVTQPLIRSMIRARSGKIINISSVVGVMGNAGQVNYAASKAGMIGLTKALAKEVSGRGITVNCIAPGFIETSMTDVLTDERKKSLLSSIPLGRLGAPSDIANAALFLASSLADYVTGQVLVVDGGMVM